MQTHRLGLLMACLTLGVAGCIAKKAPEDDDPTSDLIEGEGPPLTRLLVPGACPVGGSERLAEVDISVLLLSETGALVGEDSGWGGDLAEARPSDLSASFRFAQPSGAEVVAAEFPAFAHDEDGAPLGVDLAPRSLRYQWTGGEERRRDDSLVVLALDHSGSLTGWDPRGASGVDLGRASDPRDERITFFSQLIYALPETAYLSVLPFAGELPRITPECSTPTLNRDVASDCVTDLQRGEEGFTPLADALDSSLEQIISANADLNPVIVLFTDGTEDEGDVSGKSLDEVKGALIEAGVPVILIHLMPGDPNLPLAVRGRSAEYQALACETGGEYIFLEAASLLSDERASDLQAIVSRRVEGVWRLRTRTTLGRDDVPPGPYLLSTELTVELWRQRRAITMASGEPRDTRLWFWK